MKLDVHVQLPGGREVIAGTVEDVTMKARGQTVAFAYAPSYLADPAAYPLAPALPLTAGAFYPSGARSMIPTLADAQPDAWGRALIAARRRREARTAGRQPTLASEVEVLAAVSDETRQGALRFSHPGSTERIATGEDARPPSVLELDRLIEAARLFEAGEEIPDELRFLLAAGTSAGGARPKANVRTSAGSLALAKLPRDDDFGDAMAWEAVALHLARNAGVVTPRFHLERSGDRSVLLLERFDRTPDGLRVGYISAHSLLDKQPHSVTTYVELAEQISLESSRSDLHQLFRRVAVTLLINNVDDHMRNHGMLRRTPGWQLSPAFDINPFYRHGSVESTPVSTKDDPAGRDIRVLLDEAAAFDLRRTDAEAIVADVERATANWREVAEHYGISPEGASAMRHAFENPNREIARSLRPRTPQETR